MASKINLLLSCVGGCLFLATAAPSWGKPIGATLSGQVSSADEGPMDGVLVSAHKDGSTITTTVVTDKRGGFSFPADRLSPGHYALTIRAIGYELRRPQSADVTAGKKVTENLILAKATDLAAQLSNAEWMVSFPIPNAQKAFIPNCTGCHTLARPADSTLTQQQWPAIIKLMASFSAESTPAAPQPLPAGPRKPKPTFLAAASKVLANINLSHGPKRTYSLKTLPRPQGRATHVIITEYALPRKSWLPHDVILGDHGNVWFSDFGNQFVGELNPSTGKVTPIAIPLLKPDSPKGSLDLEKDPAGNIWVAMMYQGAIAEINPKTHAVKVFKIPAKYQNKSTQESFVSPQHSNVDGYVWTNDQDQHTLIRLNLKTGKFGKMHPETDAKGVRIPAYQIPTDRKNNVYLLNFGGTRIGYFNKKTDIASGFTTPSPNSRPRRGEVDSKDRLWFAEFGANRIGRFDPMSQKITEWELPTPWSDPYDVAYSSKFHEVWSGSMLTDMVDRLNLKTGKVTEYLLPKKTNIRRIYLDKRGVRPVLWLGNNHGAEIVKVEPLD